MILSRCGNEGLWGLIFSTVLQDSSFSSNIMNDAGKMRLMIDQWVDASDDESMN